MTFSPEKTDINHVPTGKVMPRPWFHADNTAGPMFGIFKIDDCWTRPLNEGERLLGNFILPSFQRPSVWTQEQQIRFIESAWQRLPLGAYVVNRVTSPMNNPFDGLLLDGQQRITAIMAYVAGEFPVFGHRFTDLSRQEQNEFGMIPMAYLQTKLENMDHIREVYDRLAYGGTAHDPKDTVKETFWRVYHPTTGPMEYDSLDHAQAVYDQKRPVLGGPDQRLHVKLTEVTEFERVLGEDPR
jgi:hypothetical protein